MVDGEGWGVCVCVKWGMNELNRVIMWMMRRGTRGWDSGWGLSSPGFPIMEKNNYLHWSILWTVCLMVEDWGLVLTHVSMYIKADGWDSGPGTSDCPPATQWEESRTGFWGEGCGTLRGTNEEGVRLAYKCVSGWLNNWSTGVWISEGEPYFFN